MRALRGEESNLLHWHLLPLGIKACAKKDLAVDGFGRGPRSRPARIQIGDLKNAVHFQPLPVITPRPEAH